MKLQWYIWLLTHPCYVKSISHRCLLVIPSIYSLSFFFFFPYLLTTQAYHFASKHILLQNGSRWSPFCQPFLKFKLAHRHTTTATWVTKSFPLPERIKFKFRFLNLVFQVTHNGSILHFQIYLSWLLLQSLCLSNRHSPFSKITWSSPSGTLCLCSHSYCVLSIPIHSQFSEFSIHL